MTAQYQRNVDWWRPTGNYYLIIRSELLSGCTFWSLLPDFWTNGMCISCLVKSKYIGTITWLRRVSAPEVNIRSQAVKTTETTFGGILGESHSGATRSSCVRVTMLHPKGTEIRNTRQLSILSAEENAEIAGRIRLKELDPSWLGASIVIAGIPDLTHIPPGSRLQTTGVLLWQPI